MLIGVCSVVQHCVNMLRRQTSTIGLATEAAAADASNVVGAAALTAANDGASIIDVSDVSDSGGDTSVASSPIDNAVRLGDNVVWHISEADSDGGASGSGGRGGSMTSTPTRRGGRMPLQLQIPMQGLK